MKQRPTLPKNSSETSNLTSSLHNHKGKGAISESESEFSPLPTEENMKSKTGRVLNFVSSEPMISRQVAQRMFSLVQSYVNSGEKWIYLSKIDIWFYGPQEKDLYIGEDKAKDASS